MKGCHFCGQEPTETHHIVPRRFDGTDADENLVDVCPTCHSKLESLYDKRFYDALGVEKGSAETPEPAECCHDHCTQETTNRFEFAGLRTYEAELCGDHAVCRRCGSPATKVIGQYDISSPGLVPTCDDCCTCRYRGCANDSVTLVPYAGTSSVRLCNGHAEVMGDV